MGEPRRFDVVVVGGGTAGLTAALAARHEGASVALVEREERLGGDCTYYGCVPSKSLIEIAARVTEARRLARQGILEVAPGLAFAPAHERQQRVVEEIAADERDERFTSLGIEVVHGEAAFRGPHELGVGDGTLVAERFVIATGSEPAVPPVEGLDAVPYLTNRSVFDLADLPDRLLVLGGGSIGLELAQAFQRLGSRVTVVELSDRLLPHDEPEAGQLVAGALAADGVDLRLGTKALAARKDGAEVVLALENGEARGDALLVATGRRPALAGLGLEQLGVELADGYVKADRRCRTSVKGLFAAGDVTGGLQFTHVAAHEGSVAGRNAAGKRATSAGRVVPWVTFVDPESAHVGLTEEQARKQHRRVRVATFPMRAVDRPRIEGRPNGFVKLVAAPRLVLGFLGGGKLVGAQIVGPRAGELIHECALAIHTKMFAGRLAQMIHAYPTMSMAVQQAASRFFPLGRALVGDPDEPGS